MTVRKKKIDMGNIYDTTLYDVKKVKMLRMDVFKMSQNAFSESPGVDISTICEMGKWHK